VRRKVIGGTVAALAALVIGVIAFGFRDGSSPAQNAPLRAKPAQQFGDDADLMRRLERKKLTTTTAR
jgi:hypothetical protein